MGKKEQNKSAIMKVSKFGRDRLHIEIPTKKKKCFKAGEHVKVGKV